MKDIMYDKWINSPVLSEREKQELLNLVPNEKEECFSKAIDFGTGGMRGVMRLGENGINKYTIIRATNGLISYIEDISVKKSVVIGYDNRLNSKYYATVIANLLYEKGFEVYLFSNLIPTPLLSYTVQSKGASIGIMLTASHNPKKYNGYKIYDSEGCQFLPEEVACVKKYINEDTDYLEKQVSEQFNENINYIYYNEISEYLKELEEIEKLKQGKKEITIGFSAQHGTSAPLSILTFEKFGYSVEYLDEQMLNDGNFPFTKNSNPEEIEAFEGLLKLGESENLDILLTTDPDADRLGVAVKDANEYKLLTGNQLGAVVLYYLIVENKLPGYICKTNVTSDLGAKIANKNNLDVKEVLTGFKYIGNEIIKDKDNYLFGYEESYGYLYLPIVKDKDAIQMLLLVSQITDFYKAQNKTLLDVLENIYSIYGYYEEKLLSYTFEGVEGTSKIQSLYKYFIGDFKLNNINILSEDKDNIENYYKVNFDGGWLCVRPSGTEPKVKVYISVNGSEKDVVDKEVKEIVEQIETVIDSFK